MNVLILGLGSIGRRHARCFLDAGAGAVRGFDPAAERRAAFAAEFGARVFDDEGAALESGPDLIVVASPNLFHAPQAVRAIAAGRPVLVEKPLAGDLAGGAAIAAALADHGGWLHMGSNWKFHSAFRRMKSWVEEGRIGRVLGAQVLSGSYLPDWHPWEDYRRMYAARADLQGGVVADNHELDLITWLLGPAESLVGATARSGTLEIGTEDSAACVLRLRCGALVGLGVDYLQRTPRRRYHLCGETGTIEWDLQDARVRLHRPGAPDAAVAPAQEAVNAMYEAQAARVLDDLRTGAPPVTGIDQALATLRLQAHWRGDAPCGQAARRRDAGEDGE